MLYLCSEAFFVKDTHWRLNIAVCYNIIVFMMVYKLLMDSIFTIIIHVHRQLSNAVQKLGKVRFTDRHLELHKYNRQNNISFHFSIQIPQKNSSSSGSASNPEHVKWLQPAQESH